MFSVPFQKAEWNTLVFQLPFNISLQCLWLSIPSPKTSDYQLLCIMSDPSSLASPSRRVNQIYLQKIKEN